MTPDTYFTPLKGQSLLYPGQSQIYRGQCVQSVMLWLKATGTEPPVYSSAYQYYERGIPGYTKIPAGQPIKAMDIIVWRPDFPPAIIGGVGNGHIDVAAQDGTPQDFWAWDSNWSPPLKLNRIRHNGPDNSYIFGYLRKEEAMPFWNDGDIVNAKIAETGVPAYQPPGSELDYYKQPEHEKELLYQTIKGMQAQIDALKQTAPNSHYNQIGTINGRPIYEKTN